MFTAVGLGVSPEMRDGYTSSRRIEIGVTVRL
jgi:hypothetical protein